MIHPYASAYGWSSDHILYEVPYAQLLAALPHIMRDDHARRDFEVRVHGGEGLPPLVLDDDDEQINPLGLPAEQRQRHAQSWQQSKRAMEVLREQGVAR